MKVFTKKPWYAQGLAFECARCGRCCAGPEEGYVWITKGEIQKLAQLLEIPVQQAHQRYLRQVGRRYSLVEQPDTKDCIFLQCDAEGTSSCAVHPARPAQCRTWPFWPGNLVNPGAWCLAGLRCQGINRGRLHDMDEIQRKRDQTNP